MLDFSQAAVYKNISPLILLGDEVDPQAFELFDRSPFGHLALCGTPIQIGRYRSVSVTGINYNFDLRNRRRYLVTGHRTQVRQRVLSALRELDKPLIRCPACILPWQSGVAPEVFA